MTVIKAPPGSRHVRKGIPILGIGVDPDTRGPAVAAILRAPDGKIALLGTSAGRRVANEVQAGAAVMFSCVEVADLVRRMSAAWDHMTPLKSFAVESQVIYPRDKARSKDIINLAQVAGAALSACKGGITLRPVPQEWKGSTPKETTQVRVLRRMGIKAKKVRGKVVPDDPALEGIHTPGEWEDILDAIGLAIWAADVTVP